MKRLSTLLFLTAIFSLIVFLFISPESIEKPGLWFIGLIGVSFFSENREIAGRTGETSLRKNHGILKLIFAEMKYPIAIVLIFLLFVSCQKTGNRLVISKIQKASKLATTEFTLNKAVIATKEKNLFWVVKLNEAIFVARTQAVIKAGIDLEKLKKEDVEIQDQSIRIKLPHVEIMNFSYPIDKVQIDSTISENRFLNKFTLREYDEILEQAELKIRDVIPYLGIEEATRQKTRTMLETLLKELGYTEIFLEFSDGLVLDGVLQKPSVADSLLFTEKQK